MKPADRTRQVVLSLRIRDKERRLLERAAAFLTLRTGDKHTMTDVVEIGLDLLKKKLTREGMEL